MLRTSNRWKRILKWTVICGGLCGLLGLSAGLFYIDHTLKTLPPIDAVYLNTYGTTQITDKNGDIIYEDTDKLVKSATYDELPSLYTKGLVAVEDAKFWTSKGYSVTGMLNGVLGRRGGSTIEQQLIKNTYYNGGVGYKTITRKIHEVFLAKQMDENIKKKDILTYYINKLELGENTVGAKAAMIAYFNKTPEQLKETTPENIAQLAYIVGLGQAPTSYDLYLSDKGIGRTKIVLGVWLDAKLITKSQYKEALKVDLKQTLAPRYHWQEAQKATNAEYQEYTSQVLNEVKELGYDTKTTTLHIKSYLDKDLYKQIQDTVNSGQYLDDNLQVGVAVMNADGVVVGMVGGRGTSEWNHATQQTRSSGSSMKPFTAYGPLFQYFGDKYNTASRFDTSPYVYPGTNFAMKNYGGAVYGMLDAQQALRWSLNTPVARIDDEILGSNRMKTFLSGLDLDVKDTYSANDGIGLNISPLQAAAAYNAINNGGVYTKPRFVDTITFVDGTAKKIEPRRRRAMNESVAYVLTQMLRGVPKDQIGSAPAANIPQYSGYAGKTGSVAFGDGVNNNYTYGPGGSDVWYDSITNGGYSVSVWMGYDSPNSDPQIPDTFKGQQALGKSLQLLLNGGRDVPNWAQPANVKLLSGSDLSAYYAVTDAGDVNNNLGNIISDLPDVPSIKSMTPETKAEKDWYDKLTKREKALYDAYKKNPASFENNGVLSDEVYKLINGKE